MKDIFVKTQIFTLIIVTILLITACSDATSTNVGYELFTFHAEDDWDVECKILLERSWVEIRENGNTNQPILSLEGAISTNCGNIFIYINPPTITKQVNVQMIAYLTTGPESSSETKPFYISMPINDLISRTYTIVINDQRKFSYSLPMD